MIGTFEQAALAAGSAILKIYDDGPSVSLKADCSPVTEADELAEAVIVSIISAAFPGIPLVAEEAVAAGRVPETAGGPFILVDPLDGTKEFINRNPEFTVNIALIESGAPVLGVVYAPAKGIAYSGSAQGAEKLVIGADLRIASREWIQVRPAVVPLVAVASRSHNSRETEQFLDDNGITERKSVGSSLKFCLVAEGEADVYPRFGRTMEWDTAAGDAVLRAAGGMTVGVDGEPLTYGKTNQSSDSDFANPAFIVWGNLQHRQG